MGAGPASFQTMAALAIKVGLVAGGGAIGAILRYGLYEVTERLMAPGLPWATLAANLIGSLLIGMLWAVTEQFAVHRYFVPFVFVGLLGSFTTFSTFALEGFTLIRDGQHVVGISYMILSNLAGLILVFAGYAAARSVMSILNG